MTPTQLREWLFQNSQTDQWWGAFDDVTEESAVTVDDIEERLNSGLYKNAQVLHVSQTELTNPPCIEVKLQSIGPITPAATFMVQPERELTHRRHSPRKESKQSSVSGMGVSGLLLLIVGLGSVFFYSLFFETSVDTAYGSVNNLGLMSDKQNGIIIGGILAVVGVLLGLMRKK
jgi:hypothetical protein